MKIPDYKLFDKGGWFVSNGELTFFKLNLPKKNKKGYLLIKNNETQIKFEIEEFIDKHAFLEKCIYLFLKETNYEKSI